MRKFALLLFITLVLAACGGGQAIGPVQVEIISLDHAPIRPAMQEALGVAAEFGDKVTVQSYKFDTPEGAAFAKENGLMEHTPIAIFVNGEMEFEVDGRTVKFHSFPQGEETFMFAHGCPAESVALPGPDGHMTVGLDGDSVHGREDHNHKAGWFGVIAGKPVTQDEGAEYYF